MNRVTVQSGYNLPFDNVDEYDDYSEPVRRRRLRRRRRRASRALAAQRRKMVACAMEWQASAKRGSYRAFMSKCLRK